jgi:hypothetical protein
MRLSLRILALAGVFSLLARIARGDSEIVIAIRYLQAEGISHSQMLNHIRYARENTAAICYGFSMYRRGNNPAVITLRRTSDSEE